MLETFARVLLKRMVLQGWFFFCGYVLVCVWFFFFFKSGNSSTLTCKSFYFFKSVLLFSGIQEKGFFMLLHNQTSFVVRYAVSFHCWTGMWCANQKVIIFCPESFLEASTVPTPPRVLIIQVPVCYVKEIDILGFGRSIFCSTQSLGTVIH